MTAADFRREHGDPRTVVHIDAGNRATFGWSAAEFEAYENLARIDARLGRSSAAARSGREVRGER